MTEITMAANENKEFPARGRYLYIEQATAAVVVTVDLADGTRDVITLKRREGMRFDADMVLVDVMNTTGAPNALKYHTTLGEFMPSNDGQKVTLTGQDVSIQVKTDPGEPLDVAGPLTDTELRANPVDVQGPLTDTELRAAPVPVSGPLTDTELRAAPVDVVTAVPATLTAGGVITGSATIPANLNRKRVGIKALKANTGIGWTHSAANSGDALEAGDRQTYETTDSIAITATVGTDKFAWWEEE